MKSLKNHRGFSLLLIATVVTALTATVAGLLDLGLGSQQAQSQRRGQLVAQQLAEMCLARVTADLRQITGAAMTPDIDTYLRGDQPTGGSANIPPAVAYNVPNPTSAVSVAGWGASTETVDGQVFRRMGVAGLGACYVRVDDNQDDTLPGLRETTQSGSAEGTADVSSGDRDQSVLVMARGAAGLDNVTWATATGRATLRATLRAAGPRAVVVGGAFTPNNNATLCGEGMTFCGPVSGNVNCACGAVLAGSPAIAAALGSIRQCGPADGCTRCEPLTITQQVCTTPPVPPAPTAADIDPRADDFGKFQAAAGTCFFRMDTPAAGGLANTPVVHLWDSGANAACNSRTDMQVPDFNFGSNNNFPQDCWVPIWQGGSSPSPDTASSAWAPGRGSGNITPLDGRGALGTFAARCSCTNCAATSAPVVWNPGATVPTLVPQVLNVGGGGPRGIFLVGVTPAALSTITVSAAASPVTAAVLTTGVNIALAPGFGTLTHPLSSATTPREALVAGGAGSCALDGNSLRIDHGIRCGGSVTIGGNGTTLAGNVTVGGSFNGGVNDLSVFRVSTPNPAKVWVGGNAYLKNNGSFFGNLVVTGDLDVENNSTIVGTVWAGGKFDPKSNTRVNPPGGVETLLGSTTVVGAVQALPY